MWQGSESRAPGATSLVTERVNIALDGGGWFVGRETDYVQPQHAGFLSTARPADLLVVAVVPVECLHAVMCRAVAC
jgi:hypothetical protein